MTNTWDSANRLIETHRFNEVVIQQLIPIYDGVGNRVAQVSNGVTTTFALDVQALPEVIFTGEGNAYLHLPGVIMTENGVSDVRYLLSDGLGSVRQAVDETGTVISYHEFDPYGSPTLNSEPGTENYGYTGEWWEDEIGLLYLRARWYLPETGTFLSVDPVESEPDYLYVGGNVVNRVDPSGLQGIERERGACNDWSGYAEFICNGLYNDESQGDYGLSAIEHFYRAVVWRNRIEKGWYIAASLLDHYLDGTEGETADDEPGPGEPYYIYDREWVLSTKDDKVAREDLINDFVNQHLRPAVAKCSTNPIQANLISDLIAPPGSTEVRNSLGKHTMKAYFEATLSGNDSFIADTKINFVIEDKYDFHPPLGIPSPGKFGIGFVPHQWLVDLAKGGMAAEFDMYALWNEHLSISGSVNTIMYRVNRIH